MAEQIHSLKQEFGANHIIFVGDRGMRIRYNLEQMNQAQREGVDYITGLTRLEIEQLAHTGIIQLDLFAKELVEVQDNGLRYILSVNPELERESTAKRGELRNRFEGMLSEIQCAYKKKQAHFQENLQKLQDGHKNKKLVTHFTDKQIDKYKFDVTVLMRKYNMTGFYDITIDKQKFDVQFNWESYQNTCNMDGKYVIATTVPANKMNKEEVREQYKSLQHVEHAFRDMKTTNLDIRPVFHVNGDTTRGHVLLSMFSYCIIKEIETKIFPFLKSFNSINKEQFSFRDIEEELKLIKLNILRLGGEYREIKITELTTVQEQILKLLDIDEKKLNLKQK